MEKAKRTGMDAYAAELNEKTGILEELLNNYNDGRRKSFYCTAVNLLELQDVKTVMERIHSGINSDMPMKEKSAAAVRLFEETAAHKNVSIKLRKKQK